MLFKSKKAQGISLSFIVTAAIAALVLVLIIAFTVGGLGGFFRQLTGAGPGELETIQSTCQSNCNKLAVITRDAQWSGSSYCRTTYTIDIDGDGDIEENEIGLNCWDFPINIDCTVTYITPAGTTKICASPDCVECALAGAAPPPAEEEEEEGEGEEAV